MKGKDRGSGESFGQGKGSCFFSTGFLFVISGGWRRSGVSLDLSQVIWVCRDRGVRESGDLFSEKEEG